MTKGNDIAERLINMGVQIIDLTGKLPRNYPGKHLSQQLLRSGTAPAAHYAEARGAESRRDFIHKLKICLKELNEAVVWLKIIGRSGLLSSHHVDPVKKEFVELSRIINASIKTSQSKLTIDQ